MSSYLIPIITGLFFILACACAYAFWVRPALNRAARAAASAHAEWEAENRETAIAAKEEGLRYREEIESALREREKEALRHEEKLAAREEVLESRYEELRERIRSTEARELALGETERAYGAREKQLDVRLAEIAGLSVEEATARLMERVESQHREVLARRVREIEAEAVAKADKRAKDILLDAMQRCAVEYVSEATISMVELPSDDMKGRIIGREGRNIRSFEQITGVDLIIDDTPEAVVISCFDPVRREIARLTLMNLIVDGRIHPVRIEELFEKAQTEVNRATLEAACKAVETARVGPVSTPLLETLGRLRFRTSYAQNILDHSVEVSRLAGLIAAELGLDVEVAKRAGLFHDIGKALGPEHEGPHAVTGRAYLLSEGESEAVASSVGSHHSEMAPETPEAVLISLADSLSASRPGSRKESLENYVKRLEALEKLAGAFPGVERCFAVQAGREIRIIVNPTALNDEGAANLADEVARQIEKDMEFPGQIKVTVIRETRVQNVAK
jgi:ribonucrease Y